MAEERLAGAAGERAHVADAERRAGAGAAAAPRRRAVRLPRGARAGAAHLQVGLPIIHTLFVLTTLKPLQTCELINHYDNAAQVVIDKRIPLYFSLCP